jgi:NDP-sugar pyrophosphorylase family protein
MKAVILAGGKGTRLAPYTSVLPKPLMPIGDRAILEIVVDQLARVGFKDVVFCVGHLSHLIQALFNSGSGRNVRISYVREDEPLGTAGPLKLVEGLDETFLVMNGDVLTTLDFGEFAAHHQQSGNLLTIATHERVVKIDYGVLHLEGLDPDARRLRVWEEKPELALTVSMGIYLMEPQVLDVIPPREYFDIPGLVDSLLASGEQVGAYSFDGFWLDIGRHEDYEQAAAAWEAQELGNGGAPTRALAH